MIAAYKPGWYGPVVVAISLYLGVLALLFLLWFRPRQHRKDLVAGGMVWAALGFIALGIRAASRWRPGGIIPVFAGLVDAISSLIPLVFVAIAITHWLIAQRLDRCRRRRQGG